VLLSNGFFQMDEIGIPLWKRGRKKFFNEFTMDKGLVKKAFLIIASHLSRKMKSKTGTFITVSTCTGTLQKAFELKERYNPLCENMEGAAITHVCTMYQIPVLEIRGISNRVDERDKSKWELDLAAKNCQEAVIMVLRGI